MRSSFVLKCFWSLSTFRRKLSHMCWYTSIGWLWVAFHLIPPNWSINLHQSMLGLPWLCFACVPHILCRVWTFVCRMPWVSWYYPCTDLDYRVALCSLYYFILAAIGLGYTWSTTIRGLLLPWCCIYNLFIFLPFFWNTINYPINGVPATWSTPE